MSWKGFKKALERMPHQLQTKIRKGNTTVDSEYDDLRMRFVDLEGVTKELFTHAAQFRDSLRGVMVYQTSYLEQALAIYRPISTDPEGTSQPVGAYTDEGASPELLRVADEFHRRILAIREKVEPQLSSMETSVIGPIQELLAMMKNVHKCMQKRDHKLIDYDRHRTAIEKYDAKEGVDGQRRLGDEKSYQKVTAQYQDATRQYNYFNDMLKSELQKLLELRQAFIDPIFLKFFSIQHQLYSAMFKEFSEAARNCPAFDLNSPVIPAWEKKWNQAQQQLNSIDMWGNGPMVVTPLPIEEGNRSMVGSIKGTFRKKDKNPAPNTATGIFAGQQQQQSTSGETSPYGTYRPSASSVYSADSRQQQPQQQPPPVASVATGASTGSPYGNYDAKFPATTGNSGAGGSGPPQQAEHSVPPPAYNSPAPGAASHGPPPPIVVALYDYVSTTDGDLNFKEGDRIELIQRTETKDDWWTGRLNGKTGLFPGTYVTNPKQ